MEISWSLDHINGGEIYVDEADFEGMSRDEIESVIHQRCLRDARETISMAMYVNDMDRVVDEIYAMAEAGNDSD